MLGSGRDGNGRTLKPGGSIKGHESQTPARGGRQVAVSWTPAPGKLALPQRQGGQGGRPPWERDPPDPTSIPRNSIPGIGPPPRPCQTQFAQCDLTASHGEVMSTCGVAHETRPQSPGPGAARLGLAVLRAVF